MLISNHSLESMQVSSKSLLMLLSSTQSFISIGLPNHHQQVAYLAYHIGKSYGLDNLSLKQTYLASLVHDIGALSMSDLMELEDIERVPDFDFNHATKGATLIGTFAPFKGLAPIVKHHHYPWLNGKGTSYKGEEIPFESHLLQLADAISIVLGKEKFVMKKMPELKEMLAQDKGKHFMPELVDAFMPLTSLDSLWLDFVQQNPIDNIFDDNMYNTLLLGADEILELAHMVSKIIDFRSRFTATHSAGVATTSTKLAGLFNFSNSEQTLMHIAGYLHDLGKIAIKREILEKPDKLTEDEMIEMRSHTYYTAQMLNTIPEFSLINQWASLHHERLDGKGYPFQTHGDHLSLGSRIMAVADVFTAITENRPYRDGLSKETVTNILTNMVGSGALDGVVVNKLIEHYDVINNLRTDAQDQALTNFEEFFPGWIDNPEEYIRNYKKG